jgi:NTE family protein
MTQQFKIKPERQVVIFQGGGALGAYQAGVFEALQHHGINPDWVIGTSIGAINAALLAGNRPEDRLSHLNEFWRRMGQGWQVDAPEALSQAWWPFTQKWNTSVLMGLGLPHFYKPWGLPWFALGAAVNPGQASFYDTTALKATLLELIDFDHLNQSSMRFSVGAVDIESGQMRYFDSQRERIDVEHVLASGALPPAFAPVEIDGRHYWDGGLHSNTPLEYLLQDYPRAHTVCHLANVWQEEDALPHTLPAVLRRMKELQFASRTDMMAKMEAELHRLRHALCVLEDHLQPKALQNDDVQQAASLGCLSVFHLIRLQAPRLAGEDQYKDIEFSPARIKQRWGAGYVSAQHALKDAPWEHPISLHDGVLLHDYSEANLSEEESRLQHFHVPHERNGQACIYKAPTP